MRLNLFTSILFAAFRYFFESPVYGPIPMTPFFTILSQLSILSPCCHHFVTIYDERTETMPDDKLNRVIGESYNRTKKVIAVTESMNVCLDSVEASFQMIIYAYEFAVRALYQSVETLYFC